MKKKGKEERQYKQNSNHTKYVHYYIGIKLNSENPKLYRIYLGHFNKVKEGIKRKSKIENTLD